MSRSADREILIIGYGNTLRSDDGVGRKIAEAVGGWNLPHVRAISVHQLTPEVAHDISKAVRVFFIDARLVDPAKGDDEHFAVARLDSNESLGALEHAADPRALLAMSKILYGACPVAWTITVPGINFELGETMSPQTKLEMEAALQTIARMVGGEAS